MRDVFADKYNLVTLQCSFFGSEFMQGVESFELKKGGRELVDYLDAKELEQIEKNPSALLNLLATKPITFPVNASINESKSNFNDMGFMQAIDIITALEVVKIILKENNMEFNERKVIRYGHSHGAYLLHLSNRLAPHLFSYIIDNSAWIEPVYLSGNRYLNQQYGKMILQLEFDYLAKEIVYDKRALNLNTLYKGFQNQSKMIVFQGTNDHLINHLLKEKAISKIENVEFLLIDEKKVDNYIFKSNTHGLNADFLNMFDYAYEKMDDFLNQQSRTELDEIKLSNTIITSDYTHGLPIFGLRNSKVK